MARISLLYIAAYLLTILAIGESTYYLTESATNSSNYEASYSVKIYIAMSLRIVFSLLFMLTAICFDSRPRVLIPMIALHCLVLAIVMVEIGRASCSEEGSRG